MKRWIWIVIVVILVAAIAYALWNQSKKKSATAAAAAAASGAGGCACHNDPKVIEQYNKYMDAIARGATSMSWHRQELEKLCPCHNFVSESEIIGESAAETELLEELARLEFDLNKAQGGLERNITTRNSYRQKALDCDAARAQFTLGWKKNNACHIDDRGLYYKNWGVYEDKVNESQSHVNTLNQRIEAVKYSLSQV